MARNKTVVRIAFTVPFHKASPMGKWPIGMSVNDWRTIVRRVNAGLGWSLIPASFARADSSYTVFPLRDGKDVKTFYIGFVRIPVDFRLNLCQAGGLSNTKGSEYVRSKRIEQTG